MLTSILLSIIVLLLFRQKQNPTEARQRGAF